RLFQLPRPHRPAPERGHRLLPLPPPAPQRRLPGQPVRAGPADAGVREQDELPGGLRARPRACGFPGPVPHRIQPQAAAEGVPPACLWAGAAALPEALMGQMRVTAAMNVVIVDGDLSYPANSGKRLRTLNLMIRLARRHRVTYICRGQGGAGADKARTFLGDHGVAAVVVDEPLPRKSGPLFYARLAANLLSGVPYSVATHDSPGMREAVRAHAAKHKVDLWQLEWSA